jgi:hypothetical protein
MTKHQGRTGELTGFLSIDILVSPLFHADDEPVYWVDGTGNATGTASSALCKPAAGFMSLDVRSHLCVYPISDGA